MDGAHFGAFLAELRRERGLTQAELAGRLNVTDKAISKWERGRGLPDIQLLEPIADTLNVSVEELVRCRHIPREERSGGVDRRRARSIAVCAARLAAFAAILLLPLLLSGQFLVAGSRGLGYSLVSAVCLAWLGVIAGRSLRRAPEDAFEHGGKGIYAVYAVVFLLTASLEALIAAVTAYMLTISYVPAYWITHVVIPAEQLLLAALYGTCLWKARRLPRYYPAAVQALGACLSVCGIVEVLHGMDTKYSALSQLVSYSVPPYLCGLLVSGVLLLVLRHQRRKQSPSTV